MRKYLINPVLLLKRATHIALGLVICWGFILVLAQIKPFWMDEWRLLYNLKFKPASALFGPLYFTQQFPRVYLLLLKGFTSLFDYSYFTLRLPAFITGVCSIFLGYRIMNKVYRPDQPNRYLFLLIIVSTPIFMKYLVQIKQYEMEIFLSLAGIAQLLCLDDIGRHGVQNRRRYVWLCLSFMIAPFFSYTYPIVIAPGFLLAGIRAIRLWKSGAADRKRRLLLLGTPLVLGAVSIAAFYAVDVSRVMHDSAMQCFWHFNIMTGSNATFASFFRNIWDFFGTPGSGYLYQLIFSALGITAFLFAGAKSRRLFSESDDRSGMVRQYAVLLVLVVMLLFVCGKLPLGEARLNAFTLPALAILIVDLLHRPKWGRRVRLSAGLSALLYLGLLGNVGTTILNSFTNAHYAKTLRIYSATEDAIIYAQAHNLPIVISPGVAYPSDILNDNPCMEPIDAASVLKTFPAYKERENVLVFNNNDPGNGEITGLPDGISRVEVGDGTSYKVVNKASGEHKMH